VRTEEGLQILTGSEKATSWERQQALLRMLEGKHMMSCLLYIDDTAPVLKTDICRDVPGNGMMNNLSMLEELGLIEPYRKDSESCYFTLTPKGKHAATTFRMMQQIIDDARSFNGLRRGFE